MEAEPLRVKYIFWQDGDFWLGYLADYPEYRTQGTSLHDLVEHLRDLYKGVTSAITTG